MKQRDKTRRIGFSAMLSALGVVIIYIGSLAEVLDISMAVIASLCTIVALIEFGLPSAWLVYAVTSVLAIILSPRSPALMFLLFFGYYPIIKERVEPKGKLFSWIVKELVFNVAAVAIILSFVFLFNMPLTYPLPLLIATLVLAELVFILYDVVLTRLISFYLFRLRSRFKFK